MGNRGSSFADAMLDQAREEYLERRADFVIIPLVEGGLGDAQGDISPNNTCGRHGKDNSMGNSSPRDGDNSGGETGDIAPTETHDGPPADDSADDSIDGDSDISIEEDTIVVHSLLMQKFTKVGRMTLRRGGKTLSAPFPLATLTFLSDIAYGLSRDVRELNSDELFSVLNAIDYFGIRLASKKLLGAGSYSSLLARSYAIHLHRLRSQAIDNGDTDQAGAILGRLVGGIETSARAYKRVFTKFAKIIALLCGVTCGHYKDRWDAFSDLDCFYARFPVYPTDPMWCRVVSHINSREHYIQVRDEAVKAADRYDVGYVRRDFSTDSDWEEALGVDTLAGRFVRARMDVAWLLSRPYSRGLLTAPERDKTAITTYVQAAMDDIGAIIGDDSRVYRWAIEWCLQGAHSHAFALNPLSNCCFPESRYEEDVDTSPRAVKQRLIMRLYIEQLAELVAALSVYTRLAGLGSIKWAGCNFADDYQVYVRVNGLHPWTGGRAPYRRAKSRLRKPMRVLWGQRMASRPGGDPSSDADSE